MDSKSSRRSRDERERDRDSFIENADSFKGDDSRDRDRRYRSSGKHKSTEAAAEDHRRHHDSTEKHHSKHRDRSGDERIEREGSRERVYESERRDKRQGSHERESRSDRGLKEDSVERWQSSKRKERGDIDDRLDGSEKRARVLDSVEEGKERRDRRRFGAKAEKEPNEKQKPQRKRFADGDVDSEVRDSHKDRGEKRERRKFEDRVKREEMDADDEGKGMHFDSILVKKEAKDGPNGDHNLASGVNGEGKSVALASVNGPPRTLPIISEAPTCSPPTKVSSTLTTNENKGVNITGSHEVPGKSSTDGTSSAGKSGKFSLDALAKAKRALQMQKELAEKLKKLPLSNKSASSEANLQMRSKEGAKGLSSRSELLPTTVSSSTLPAAASASEKSALLPTPVSGSAGSGTASQPGLTPPGLEAVKRAQEFVAKLGFRPDPQFAPLINMFPGQMPQEVTIQPKPAKAPVLRLDALGREIDEHGNVVNTSKVANLSTLKVNINKQKKDAFQILKPELDVDPEKNPHFDPSMGINSKKLLRPKKSSFLFVEEGKWSRDAEIIKLKSQFGEAQAKELRVKQAQLAKAKAEPDINPNLIEVSERVITKEKPKEVTPEIEWWDQPLLHSGAYGDIGTKDISEDRLKLEKITMYVEHPRPIEPPAEPAPPPPQPLKLTKKEQKKLRTQRRLAREKDRQEMIRQGLLEPPKPKVKMSNLMKVLGSEATQDPTKLEMEIRSAAAEREQAHVDRNIARKLTPDERREKKMRKLFDDPTSNLEAVVSVYRISDLSQPENRFRVDVNAQQNRLTGCAVISEGMSVVVVEGGTKSIKRYGKLMLRRIDWAASAVKNKDEVDEDDDDKPKNKCVLVWQGSVAKNSFPKFSFHECRTEAAARKVFSDAGVGHYWDLAVNFAEDQ